MMVLIICRLYKDDKEKKFKVLKRYLEFMLVIFYISIFLVGIFGVMEEENVKNKEFDVNSINVVKLSLMGLVFGIGDLFFWGILKFIVVGVGIVLVF